MGKYHKIVQPELSSVLRPSDSSCVWDTGEYESNSASIQVSVQLLAGDTILLKI